MADTVDLARRRALVGAMHDTGLLTIVGPHWVQPTDDGLVFTSLRGRTARDRVRQIELIASSVGPVPAPPPGPGQVSLPF